MKGVYGNIDGIEIRSEFPEQLVFYCEDVKVMMRHIGGSPPKYNPETRKELAIRQPQLFISGHSHILKVMFDDKINCLHINPGAAGRQTPEVAGRGLARAAGAVAADAHAAQRLDRVLGNLVRHVRPIRCKRALENTAGKNSSIDEEQQAGPDHAPDLEPRCTPTPC